MQSHAGTPADADLVATPACCKSHPLFHLGTTVAKPGRGLTQKVQHETGRAAGADRQTLVQACLGARERKPLLFCGRLLRGGSCPSQTALGLGWATAPDVQQRWGETHSTFPSSSSKPFSREVLDQVSEAATLSQPPCWGSPLLH